MPRYPPAATVVGAGHLPERLSAVPRSCLPVAPGADDGLQLGSAGLELVEVGEAHGADQLAVPLEATMGARDLRASVEHDAELALGGVEAGDVALVGEGGRLPLDGLGDPVVGPEDDVAGPPHGRVQGVVGLVEPAVYLGVAVHGRPPAPAKAAKAAMSVTKLELAIRPSRIVSCSATRMVRSPRLASYSWKPTSSW